MTTVKQNNHQNKMYKVMAQTVGLMVCLFFMFFILGEGIPDIIKGKGEELIQVLPLILLPIVGYFVAWFNEKIGMMMLIGGAILLAIYFIIFNNYKASLVYSVPFLVTGVLFWLHLKKQHSLKTRK